MAILKLPVVIDGVKSIEELANRVLDEYEYHGRTIKEWADLISKIPPHGRLVDADEMFEEFVIEGQRSKRYKIGEKWELNGEEIRGVISRLPTIIPAEEDE